VEESGRILGEVDDEEDHHWEAYESLQDYEAEEASDMDEAVA